MKRLLTIGAVVALAAGVLSLPTGALAAKPAQQETKPAAKAKAKLPAKAVCVICAAKTGKQELEPVHSSLNYKGKTYYFCEDKDKAEFISNPAKYAK